MTDAVAESSGTNGHASQEDAPSIEKVTELLRTKNDTSRFVGLALLKSVLDNSAEIRNDEEAVSQLWESISPRFLDRLLKTGASPSHKDAKDMLDLAVSVIHTFALLLAPELKKDAKLVGRLPLLLASILHSSQETTDMTLQTLATIVSSQEGATAFNQAMDISALVEITPSHPLALDVLSLAWMNASTTSPDTKENLRIVIDDTLSKLVAAFRSTDAVTLISFLARLLPNLDPELIPQNPEWLNTVIGFIRNLVSSRPTAAGREAYTNLAAVLLQLYPLNATPLLFSPTATAPASKTASTSNTTAATSSNKNNKDEEEKPFSYLLLTLLLIDLRSTLPTLLASLNSVTYYPTSARLASSLDILSSFIGHLVRTLDDADGQQPSTSNSTPAATSPMPASTLLSLRKNIAETLSLVMEYLRDRFDAATAGALGLHPDARPGDDRTAALPLTWESSTASIADDALTLAAVRALALWLREDDNESLRSEAAGLADLLIDLYRTSCSAPNNAAAAPIDFRRPVLVALEGITATEDGVSALLEQEGWKVLTADLIASLGQQKDRAKIEQASLRGIEIIRVLLPIVEAETPPPEDWLDLVTRVAGTDVSSSSGKTNASSSSTSTLEFQVAVLSLVTSLLANTHPASRRRYRHSISAIIGIARQIRRKLTGDSTGLVEEVDDVLDTLRGL